MKIADSGFAANPIEYKTVSEQIYKDAGVRYHNAIVGTDNLSVAVYCDPR